MINLIKNIIFPNKQVNRISIVYIKTQLKLLLYKFNIYPKFSYIDGVKIPNYSKNVVTYKILSSGSYEKEQIKIIKKYLNKNSYFFDIGTNNGFFSFYFEKKLKNLGKIFAFDAMNSLIILNNKVKKQYNLNINFENVVFGSRREKKIFNFNYNKLNYIHSRNLDLVKKKNLQIFKKKIFKYSLINNKKIYLNTITFDEYLEKNNIKKVSFIKIDIDGSELEFLLGAINSIIKFKPYILCEIDYEVLKHKIFNYSRLNIILNKYYNIFKLNKNKLIRIPNFNISKCNGYYFFKKNNLS